jgi:ATP synthase F1 gamma subunit
MRVRATKNVSKITNVMKLVASSKLRGVEEQLNRGRAFGVSWGGRWPGGSSPRLRRARRQRPPSPGAPPAARLFPFRGDRAHCLVWRHFGGGRAGSGGGGFTRRLAARGPGGSPHPHHHHPHPSPPTPTSPRPPLSTAATQEAILDMLAEPEKVKDDAAKKDKGGDDDIKGMFTADVNHLCVLITTDRGLCGAVNSSLARSLRRELNAAAKDKRSVRLITLGDKGRAQIARDYSPQVVVAVDQVFEKDPIFPLAASIASRIVSEPYDLLTLYYNHYENQAKFHNVFKQIPQLAALKPGAMPPSLKGYDLEPEEASTLVNFQQYGIAAALYFAMLETTACETSQRVMAMDSATENALAMVAALSLQYNRARQAKITTELTEIISGAESLNTGATEE